MNAGSIAPQPSSPASMDDALVLLELSRTVTGSLDLQHVLDNTFAALRTLLPFGGGAIQLIEDGHLVAAATDPPASPEAATVRIPVGHGVSGAIAATGEPTYIPNIWVDPRVHPQGRKKGVSAGVTSYFGFPIIIQGKVAGVIQIDSPDEDAFTPEMRARVLAFEPTVAAAIQNAQLYEREHQTRAALEQAERMKRDFLAIIPHELRTPLTTVAGFGQTLAAHAAKLDAETVADFGERIWRASRRLERVMSDLLDLSNIEQGRLFLDLEPCDVEPIVTDVARAQDDGKHELRVEVERDLPRAMVDADRLAQIIGNLVSNARKFTPEGTSIDLRAYAAADHAVTIEVTDRGSGIPGELIERIFDRFYQVEPAHTRSTEGMGIGLYLVRRLCDAMTIDVRVASGRDGTTFTLQIPRA